jgi:fatty-acyl-CoA synthase
MPNRPEYLEAFFAALLVGASPTNVNYRYLAPEVREILADANATFVVCGPEQHAVVVEACAGMSPEPAILRTGTDYEAVLATTEPAQLHHEPSDDDLVLIYTGGTTGRPKGVEWRVADMYAAFWESARPGKPMIDPVEAVRSGKRSATLLPASPLMHGTALFAALGTLCGGGTLVLLDSLGLDPIAVWEAVARETVQTLVVVGDAFARPLLDTLDAEPTRWQLEQLNTIVSSGVAWSPATKRGLLAYLPHIMLVDSLGATEGLIARTDTTAGDDIQPARFPMNDRIRVLGDDDSDVMPGSGAVGRIAVARHVPIGYRNDPERSAATFRPIDGERYAITGDLATVEIDGTITLLGRGSACINTGGEKVFPEEVEHVLRDHPLVTDILIVGIPDDRFGEVVAAVVVAATADAATLDGWCRARLAAYKVPRHYAFVDDLGRSAAGKADYARLRALAAKHSVTP